MQIQTTNVHTPRTVREAIPRAENLQQSATWYYSSTIPTTKYDSSTTVYYNVLFQYYSVLQGPTKYAPSTTLYYMCAPNAGRKFCRPNPKGDSKSSIGGPMGNSAPLHSGTLPAETIEARQACKQKAFPTPSTPCRQLRNCR